MNPKTLTLLLLMAFLGGLSAYIISVIRQAEPALRPACADTETKEKMRKIMLGALDQALNDRVLHLFEIWIRDASGQPGRARQGIETGIANYLHGRGAILEWDIPIC